jgi:murein DD-endopeptidase MepM/ murein hydrolase activator NlpD
MIAKAKQHAFALTLAALLLAVPAATTAAAPAEHARLLGDAAGGPQEARRPLVAPQPAGVYPLLGPGSFGDGADSFGASRSGHVHEGQDILAAEGTPLVAVREGVVLETGDDGGRGNFISFYSPQANETYVYMHMAQPAREHAGQRLRAGERVGSVGCTGSCWGDHLHFEERRGRGTQAPAVNPLPLLLRLKQS